MDRYQSFAELSQHHEHGVDYQITVISKPDTPVSIIAPHAGHIERGTSAIAKALAGNEFNLYLFEGLRQTHNYDSLHITSHLFDEPSCLSLISDSPVVISIHGCNGTGEKLFLGGLDYALIRHLEKHLLTTEINVESENHSYPGLHPNNICNRGATSKGVQIELTGDLREGSKENLIIETLRRALLDYLYD